MRLRPLYTPTFRYPDGWEVPLKSSSEAAGGPAEEQHFYFAEEKCEGEVSGEFRGANHPHRRVDRNFEMDLQGFIETRDGATITIDYRGYGRTHKRTDPPVAGKSSARPGICPTANATTG